MCVKQLAVALVAVSAVACSGSSPTGPTSPATNTAFVGAHAQDVQWECSEQDGWLVCVDTDPPAPPPPAPVEPPCVGILCTEYP